MASLQMAAALRQIHELFETGTIAGLADGQLLERYITRTDESAFAALVGRHGPMVLGVCRAVLNDSPEVEDAFQVTFLVLIRKARTIRGRDAVGGWLHRVAHRVAVHASLERSRKDNRECGLTDLSALAGAAEEASDHEWRAPLHEEVARLPERFRLPVVLCYLEGKTHAQAAYELRWGEATLRRRLSDARALLRSRLTRRGVAVSSGSLAVALARQASAAVPTGWAEALAQAAVALPAGQIAARGAISIAAARLAQTLTRGMLAGQTQSIATAVLLLVAVSLVAAHLIPAGLASAEASKSKSVKTAAPRASSSPEPVAAPKPERHPDAAGPAQTLTVSGRVLDPEGKPFAGAKIYSYRSDPRGDVFMAGPPAPSAVSGADGRFGFQIADPGFQTLQVRATWSHPTVAALAPGFGPGWTSFTTTDEAKDVTVKLVRDDVPIVGRVVDLEGRPIPGVTISPVGLYASPDENLAAWEVAMARAKDIYDGAMGKLPKDLELFRWREQLSVTTGADGRFRLTGIGRERVVSLWIEGPTIVTSFADIHARTRPGPLYRLAQHRENPEYGTLVFHGATFDHAAAPTRPIEGMVRDKDSGKPLAGVSIRSDRFAANIFSGRDHVRTTTDEQGRYRLAGMPGGAGNVITANCGPTLPYLGASAQVPSGTVSVPAIVDFALKRGVAIRGKVTDKETGKPVAALVEFFTFAESPYHGDARRLHGGEVRTLADGSFVLAGVPGRGLAAARAEKDHFLVGQGADKISGADKNGWFLTSPHMCDPNFKHAIAEITPAEGVQSAICNLALDPGRTRQGTVEGPDGKPLAGCVAINLCPGTMSPSMVRLASAAFTAVALDPKQPRPLFFRHEERKLAGIVMGKGDEPGPLTVRLQPEGTVTGRLLDDDGGARTDGVSISVSYAKGQFGPGSGYLFTFLQPTPGDDGRFRVEGLIPGVTYDLGIRKGNSFFDLDRPAKGLRLLPGETHDLGDVQAQQK